METTIKFNDDKIWLAKAILNSNDHEMIKKLKQVVEKFATEEKKTDKDEILTAIDRGLKEVKEIRDGKMKGIYLKELLNDI